MTQDTVPLESLTPSHAESPHSAKILLESVIQQSTQLVPEEQAELQDFRPAKHEAISAKLETASLSGTQTMQSTLESVGQVKLPSKPQSAMGSLEIIEQTAIQVAESTQLSGAVPYTSPEQQKDTASVGYTSVMPNVVTETVAGESPAVLGKQTMPQSQSASITQTPHDTITVQQSPLTLEASQELAPLAAIAQQSAITTVQAPRPVAQTQSSYQLETSTPTQDFTLSQTQTAQHTLEPSLKLPQSTDQLLYDSGKLEEGPKPMTEHARTSSEPITGQTPTVSDTLLFDSPESLSEAWPATQSASVSIPTPHQSHVTTEQMVQDTVERHEGPTAPATQAATRSITEPGSTATHSLHPDTFTDIPALSPAEHAQQSATPAVAGQVTQTQSFESVREIPVESPKTQKPTVEMQPGLQLPETGQVQELTRVDELSTVGPQTSEAQVALTQPHPLAATQTVQTHEQEEQIVQKKLVEGKAVGSMSEGVLTALQTETKAEFREEVLKPTKEKQETAQVSHVGFKSAQSVETISLDSVKETSLPREEPKTATRAVEQPMSVSSVQSTTETLVSEQVLKPEKRKGSVAKASHVSDEQAIARPLEETFLIEGEMPRPVEHARRVSEAEVKLATSTQPVVSLGPERVVEAKEERVDVRLDRKKKKQQVVVQEEEEQEKTVTVEKHRRKDSVEIVSDTSYVMRGKDGEKMETVTTFKTVKREGRRDTLPEHAVEIQEITEEEEKPLRQPTTEATVEFEEVIEEQPSAPASRRQSKSSVTQQQSLEIEEIQAEETVQPIKKKQRKESLVRQTITESKGVEIEEVQEVEKEKVMKEPREVPKSQAKVDVQRSEAVKSEVQVASEGTTDLEKFTTPQGTTAKFGVQPQKSLEVQETRATESTGVVPAREAAPEATADSDIVVNLNIVQTSPQVHDSAAEFTGKFKPQEGKASTSVEETAGVIVRETVPADAEAEFTGKFKPQEGKATPSVEETVSLNVSQTVADSSVGEFTGRLSRKESLATSSVEETHSVVVSQTVPSSSVGEKPEEVTPGSRRASERFEVDVFKTVTDESVKVDQAPEKKVVKKVVEKRKASVTQEVAEKIEEEVEEDVGEVVMLKPKKKVEVPKDEPEAEFTIPKKPEVTEEEEDASAQITLRKKPEKVDEPDEVSEMVTLKPKKKVEKPKDEPEAEFTMGRKKSLAEEFSEALTLKRKTFVVKEEVTETLTDFTLRPKLSRVETLEDSEFTLKKEAIAMGEESVSSDITIKKKVPFKTQDLPAESVTLMQLDQTFEDIEGDYRIKLPGKERPAQQGTSFESAELSVTDATLPLFRKGRDEREYTVEESEGAEYQIRKKSYTSEEIDQDLSVKLKRKTQVDWKTEEEAASLKVVLQLPEIVEGLEPVTSVEVGEVLELVVVVKKTEEKYEARWFHEGREVTEGVRIEEQNTTIRFIRRVEKVTLEEVGSHKVVIGRGTNTVSVETRVVVRRKCSFSEKLQDMEVVENETALFTVILTEESSEVTWHKDGEPLKQSDRIKFIKDDKLRQLVIKSVSVHDEGEYTVVIIDNEKECSAEMNVVELPPELKRKLQDTEDPRGDRGFFEIEVTKGDALVHWYKDDVEIQFSEHVQLAIDGKRQRLVIVDATPEDQGVYACRIGVEDKYSSSAKLTVTEPRVYFKRKLPDLTNGEENGEVELMVEVSVVVVSDETCTVTWIRNTTITIKSTEKYKLVKKGTKRILRINKMSKSEDREFKCVITGTNVETSTTINFTTIQTAPKLLNKQELSEVIRVSYHENVVKRAKFTAGNPTAETKWVVDDGQLDIKINEGEEGVSELAVYDVTKDFGVDFKVWNTVGEDRVRVEVHVVGPPSRPGRPQPLEKTDNSVTLTWKAPSHDGRSPITNYLIQYRKSSESSWKTVNESTTIEETVYTVTKLEKKVSYVFRIYADNSIGRSEPSEESQPILVEKEVDAILEFVEELKDTQVKIGEALELKAVVKGGDGKETCKWYKDTGSGAVEIRGGSYEHRVCRLAIHEVEPGVEGAYTVAVTGKSGKVISSCNVIVQEPLQLLLESTDSHIEQVEESFYKYKLELESTLSLIVRVVGYPLPDIKVTRNDQEYEHCRVIEGKRKIVISKSVDLQDAGNYVFSVSNKITRAKLRVLVTVIDTTKTKPERPGPPEPPFSISPVPDSQSLHLRWNPPLSDGGSELIKYSVEMRTRQSSWQKMADVQADSNSFTQQKVEERVLYTFRVTAENAVGKSEPLVSEPVSIDALRKLRLPPPEPPFEISGMTSTSFTLRWVEPKKPNDIVGYLVERREQGKKAWQESGKSETNSLDVCGLKAGISYHFRVCSVSEAGECSEFIMVQEEGISIGKRITAPSPPQNLQILAVTSRSVTIQWSPPKSTGGGELTSYILEKRLEESETWEKIVTLETSITQYQISNLRERSVYYFRVFAENAVGISSPCTSARVVLKTHATPPSPPTAPLESRQIGLNTILLEWGIPESDGGAPIEGYVIAIRDVEKRMWMEVGQVGADDQKLTVKELHDGREYLIRIFARNEIGLSEPLESEESIKICNAKLDPSALAAAAKHAADDEATEKETPSLSLTETTTSWMREAGMDADIRFYSRSALLRRNEYFFRFWHYAKELFK